MRSDEFYSNLNPFYEAIINNPSKITTSDIYFRQDSIYPLHPSDHIVGGKTQMLKKVFEASRVLCESIENVINNEIVVDRSFNPFTLTPEQMLGMSAIQCVLNKDDIKNMSNIELMKKTFYIVKASNLGTIIVTSSSNKKLHTDDSYFQSFMDIDNIENYK
jgi:hypothetical protein